MKLNPLRLLQKHWNPEIQQSKLKRKKNISQSFLAIILIIYKPTQIPFVADFLLGFCFYCWLSEEIEKITKWFYINYNSSFHQFLPCQSHLMLWMLLNHLIYFVLVILLNIKYMPKQTHNKPIQKCLSQTSWIEWSQAARLFSKYVFTTFKSIRLKGLSRNNH